jgi:nicotinamidase/pyrazinamidase
VAGAHADMLRTAAFIRTGGSMLDEITVTLDSHHHIDLAHPTFWQTADEMRAKGVRLLLAD